MKSYTNIEQSKKLAKILPIESADMYYSKYNTINANTLYGSCDIQYFNIHEYIPCWSLAALLEVMPKQLGRYTLTFYWCDGSWCCSYIDDGSEIKETSSANELVDACYAMILKLHELNLL